MYDAYAYTRTRPTMCVPRRSHVFARRALGNAVGKGHAMRATGRDSLYTEEYQHTVRGTFLRTGRGTLLLSLTVTGRR